MVFMDGNRCGRWRTKLDRTSVIRFSYWKLSTSSPEACAAILSKTAKASPKPLNCANYNLQMVLQILSKIVQTTLQIPLVKASCWLIKSVRFAYSTKKTTHYDSDLLFILKINEIPIHKLCHSSYIDKNLKH
ncbi:uncharacterized protein LOC114419020 [Glycine soja]|uniref:uncharacterized protein LOC114419020 n=1 Tax=Glycine soja TaxID=3848 RepID=UPI00103DA685|nr:uncharacterized protein LOC114419020 [Glycine soja]